MHVELQCYGTVREDVGRRSVRLDLPDDATVGDAVDELVDATPGLDRPPVVVRNGSHVRHLDGPDTRLSDGDVLSLSSSAMPE